MIKNLGKAILISLLASSSLHAATANYCGDLTNAYGPFDYRRRAEFQDNFRLVENAHFPPDVEHGIRGLSSSLGGDLDYTLRAIPNHHKALITVASVALRDNAVQIPGMRYPVECWFNRALRFTPNDAAVYVSYGGYLFSLGKAKEAEEIFTQGIAYEPDNATLNYNLGLVHFKLQNYGKARMYAKKAYELGFPLPGLKNKLMEVKRWE